MKRQVVLRHKRHFDYHYLDALGRERVRQPLQGPGLDASEGEIVESSLAGACHVEGADVVII